MNEIPLIIKFDDDTQETAEIYVEGRMNTENCRFLLDTGCAKTKLMFDDVTGLHESEGSHFSSGALGSSELDLITIDNLQVGPLVKTKFSASRAKKGVLDRNLLGMDFLKEHCLHFKFRDKSLHVVRDNKFRSDKSTQKLVLERGLIPYVRVNCGGNEVNAVWDSGAGITLVDLDFIKRNSPQFEEIGVDVGTDWTGKQQETPIFMMKTLSIAGQKFRPHKVAGLNFSDVNSKIEIPMVFTLGFSTLRQAEWVFDFPNLTWGISSMIF